MQDGQDEEDEEDEEAVCQCDVGTAMANMRARPCFYEKNCQLQLDT